MDKEGNIQRHSQEKLLVYKSYLNNYLSLLTNTKWFNRIFIWEPFAGKGRDEQEIEGSALIAAKIIKNFRKKSGKEIRLFLNELDREHFNSLYVTWLPVSY